MYLQYYRRQSSLFAVLGKLRPGHEQPEGSEEDANRLAPDSQGLSAAAFPDRS